MTKLSAPAWLLLGAAAAAACDRPSERRSEHPSASAPAVAGAAAVHDRLRFTVDPAGAVSYSVDAASFVGKGRCSNFRGGLDIDPEDLFATRGALEIDLEEVKASSASDADENARETRRLRDALELGSELGVEDKARNRWARLELREIRSAAPTKLRDAPERDGGWAARMVATADFLLHGVTSRKVVALELSGRGSAGAITSFRLATTEPFAISLKEHDVLPRDAFGKVTAPSVALSAAARFDRVLVSVDRLTLKRSTP